MPATLVLDRRRRAADSPPASRGRRRRLGDDRFKLSDPGWQAASALVSQSQR